MTAFYRPICRALLTGSVMVLTMLTWGQAGAVEEGQPAPDFTLPGVRASDSTV
mgnify:FL=1